MRVEYDKAMCDGWFQCIQEWDAFEMNVAERKARLEGSEEVDGNVFVRHLPERLESVARAAAESCPVNAIIVYDDGERIAPAE